VRAAAAIGARELRATFSSPFGYGLVAGYLSLAGLLLVLALRDGEARLDGWFTPLFILTAALCALLTMRSFAEEERSGSLELLLTAPVRARQVVAGKLLGVLGVVAVVLAATTTAPIIVSVLGDPDGGPIITGYLGVALVAASFSALGLLASACTSSQLVAAAMSVGALLGLWFGASVAGSAPGVVGAALTYLSPANHVGGFLRGTVALVDVVYFASFIAVALAAATAALRVRR
jgi:ABC-2 type transport system permease protein